MLNSASEIGFESSVSATQLSVIIAFGLPSPLITKVRVLRCSVPAFTTTYSDYLLRNVLQQGPNSCYFVTFCHFLLTVCVTLRFSETSLSCNKRNVPPGGLCKGF